MPKTSVGFVLVLIIITIIGVWTLMKLDPKRHSIEIYEANILALFWKKMDVKISTGPTNTWTNTWVGIVTGSGTKVWTWLTSSWALEDNEKKMVKERWLTIRPDIITNADGSISYLYNWKVYNKDELQEQLKKEVKAETDKKTKDYLNKIYMNNLK